MNRGPFSLAEEVLRLADAADRAGAPFSRLLSLLEVYTEAAVLLGRPVQQKISELIDLWLLPSVLQTREGLFLAQFAGEPESRTEIRDSVRAGRLFLQAAEVTGRPSLALVGRSLLQSALSLADSEAFVPARGGILSGRFRPLDGELAPEALYGFRGRAALPAGGAFAVRAALPRGLAVHGGGAGAGQGRRRAVPLLLRLSRPAGRTISSCRACSR